MGKGENAGYQHFLLFPQWFQNPSLWIVWLREKIDMSAALQLVFRCDQNHVAPIFVIIVMYKWQEKYVTRCYSHTSKAVHVTRRLFVKQSCPPTATLRQEVAQVINWYKKNWLGNIDIITGKNKVIVSNINRWISVLNLKDLGKFCL